MNISINDDSSIYECGKGWHSIIDNALCLIENTFDVDQSLYIEQVKEKFGGLRIYLSESTPEIEEAITGAEILASVTCEDCGTVKNVGLSSGGWMRTLCVDCHKKTNNTRFKLKKIISGSHEYIVDFGNTSIIGSYIEIYGSNIDGSKEYWRVAYKPHRRYGNRRIYQCLIKQRPSRKIRKQFNGY